MAARDGGEGVWVVERDSEERAWRGGESASTTCCYSLHPSNPLSLSPATPMFAPPPIPTSASPSSLFPATILYPGTSIHLTHTLYPPRPKNFPTHHFTYYSAIHNHSSRLTDIEGYETLHYTLKIYIHSIYDEKKNGYYNVYHIPM